VIENASRADQRILATTLSEMEPTISSAKLGAPALTFVGLTPRAALNAELDAPAHAGLAPARPTRSAQTETVRKVL
jgi:uroporphyrin-III C-methyltransferase/precorrin-2 dehydrogenase/sirohydrochlorin ferrochelatase